MAHKTLTVSEEAYRALEMLKKGKESFTDVILKVTKGKKNAAKLLKYVERMKPDEQLAKAIESVYNQRIKIKFLKREI